MSKNKNDICETIKVILLGENGVGKTCLFDSFFGERLNQNPMSTITPQSHIKLLEINK